MRQNGIKKRKKSDFGQAFSFIHIIFSKKINIGM